MKKDNAHQNIVYPEVGVKDVFSYFWRAVRLHLSSFLIIIVSIILATAAETIAPIYYKKFFDVLSGETPSTAAVSLLTSFVITVMIYRLAGWIMWRIGNFTSTSFQSAVIAELKNQSYEYLIRHSYNFFTNNFTGSLVQRINRYARAFERLSDRFIWNILPLFTKITVASIILWNIKPVITLGILAYLTLFLSFNYFFGRWKLKYSIEMAATDSRATAVLADTISNHASIQLFTGYSAESRNYKDVTDKQRIISRFNWNLDGVTNAIQAMLMILVEFFLFYFAIRLWNTGTFTLGSFVLIQAYLLSLGNNLWDFSRIIRDGYEGFADSKEMVQILMLDHDIVDVPKATPLQAEKGEIRFENVSFGFHTNRTVVKNINLVIHAGEKIALVGPSGAGKSTLVKLLLRLYDPTEGRILIDGQDSAIVKHESLLDATSLVPQDPLLFHRTLRENIRYGRRNATNEEVERAGRAAHCDEFVKNLPTGYETYVGERGIKLSGGERQRVAIARALLKNAPILVLDEATSSLDSHSESLIQEALDTLMKGKTTIVIAHRLSTIRKMDRVIVLDEGKITEEGSHEELLENDASLYKKLWALQAGGFLQD